MELNIYYLLFIFGCLLSIDRSIQLANNKKYPTYSLDNMPRTAFSCRDKILGGYYADADTQCQMFHVCVKVAGVGVQDFRFLCPNGTAFDQEAQTCADWGDVDCEQATLYYGSDNFDLYRIGSGLESKRAPFAEEEEATFHLQRAETNDARRSKESVVNQKVRPDKIPPFSLDEVSINFSKKYQVQPTAVAQSTASPVGNQFQRKEAQISSSTPSHITVKPESNNGAQKPITYNNNNNDEIFKGSHSSNFFSSNNDDADDYGRSSTVKPRTRQRGRSKYVHSTIPTQAPTTQTTTSRAPRTSSTVQPRITQSAPTKITLSTAAYTNSPSSVAPPTQQPTNFNRGTFNYNNQLNGNSNNYFNGHTLQQTTTEQQTIRRQQLLQQSPLQQQFQPQYNNHNFGTAAPTTAAPAYTTFIVNNSPSSPAPIRNQQLHSGTSSPGIQSNVNTLNQVPPNNFNKNQNYFPTANNINANNNFGTFQTTSFPRQPLQQNNNHNTFLNSTVTHPSPTGTQYNQFGQFNQQYQQSQQSQQAQQPQNNQQYQPNQQQYNNNQQFQQQPQQQQQQQQQQYNNLQNYNTTTFQQGQQQQRAFAFDRTANTSPGSQLARNSASQTTTTTRKPFNEEPPNYKHQDFINRYNTEQEQRRIQTQTSTSTERPAFVTPERKPQQFNNFGFSHIDQQKRLHYDINDYLTTDRYTNKNQYSPNTEQYTSVQAKQFVTDQTAFKSNANQLNQNSNANVNNKFNTNVRNNFNENFTQRYNSINRTSASPSTTFAQNFQAPQQYQQLQSQPVFNQQQQQPQQQQPQQQQQQQPQQQQQQLPQQPHLQQSHIQLQQYQQQQPQQQVQFQQPQQTYKQYQQHQQHQQQQQAFGQQNTALNGNYNNQIQPANAAQSSSTPTTTRRSEHVTAPHKKFSTLVPKEYYAPTTFKPHLYFNPKSIDTTAKLINDNLSTPSKYYSPPTTSRSVAITAQKSQKLEQSTKSTLNNKAELPDYDEDDGQYHPELYEQDFYRNKLKYRKKQLEKQQKLQQQIQNQLSQLTGVTNGPATVNTVNNFKIQTTTPARSNVNNVNNVNNYINSNEDEVLNTAHSQNIAASGNELRAEKAKNAAGKQSTTKPKTNPTSIATNQSSALPPPRPFSKAPTIPPHSKSTQKPVRSNEDEDASYDYAYYDTSVNDTPSEYSDVEFTEFGKTRKSKKH